MRHASEIEELQERLAAAEELSAQLEQALQTRIVIEQAKGILAERLGLGVDGAFELLRYAARSSRTGLRDLAARVVCERATPSPVVVALARQSRWRAALTREHNEALRARTHDLVTAVEAQAGRPADPRR